jgi:flagellar biosynthesis protein FliR
MRTIGLLFISPLLSNKAITATTRIYLGVFITLLLSLALYPEYTKGAHAELPSDTFHSSQLLTILLTCIKELAIGYFIGFCFNILFEAIAMSGEIIDNMIGFSTAQIINPLFNTFYSVIGQLLFFSAALFILIWDFHHVFIRALADSFTMIPLGHLHINKRLMDVFILETSWIYSFSIKYAAIPIVILTINLLGIACTIRVVPEMNLLLTGVPLRVLYGLWSLILAISWIVPLFRSTFIEIARVVEWILREGF